MPISQTDIKPSHILPLASAACEGYLNLFRKYVSRTSAGKGRAVLEGVGLAPETIRACYGRHPLDEEDAVQDGLIKWAEGHHGYSPTWRVLLDAIEYAGVAQQHCQRLQEELYQKMTPSVLKPYTFHLSSQLDQTTLNCPVKKMVHQLIQRRFLLVPEPS